MLRFYSMPIGMVKNMSYVTVCKSVYAGLFLLLHKVGVEYGEDPTQNDADGAKFALGSARFEKIDSGLEEGLFSSMNWRVCRGRVRVGLDLEKGV